jgi:hypothetical protein
MTFARRRRDDRRPSQDSSGPQSDPAEIAAEEIAEQIQQHGPFSVPVDLANVRIHHDESAVRSIGALAYTFGTDIVLGDQAAHADPDTRLEPQSRPGPMLAHELGHIVADAHRPGPPVVRHLIRPEDVSREMVGQSLITVAALSTPGGSVPAGTTVTVLAWDNSLPTVRVRVPAAPPRPAADVDVDKSLLRPARPVVAGIAPYSAGVAAQAATVTRGRAAIAAESARPGGPRPGEIPRLAGLQQTREELLNRRLIQETMFNRFDPMIKHWTDHYNTQFGFTGSARLDPNLVKSMLFEESQMGTSGQHLLPVPPSDVSRKTVFNIGQVVDTSGPALLIMIGETDPALLATHHLTSLRADLVTAQGRHRDLGRKASRTPAEDAELANLERLSEPGSSWETYFWEYRATGSPTGFVDAVHDFFAAPAGGTSRRMDYDFWIRTAIRWLFEKRGSVGSWAEAIRAYNGSGAKAQHYREAVVARSSSAIAAQGAGQAFTPGGI